MGKIRSIWGLLTGKRDYLTLIALAVAAAALYAWGATGRADRDRLIAWADSTCAAAGARFQDDGKRGAACDQRVRHLASFERETILKSNAVMGEAMAEHDRKAMNDLAEATRNAKAAANAALKMEQANDRISPDDRVGADWFGAINDHAGLHPADN